MKGEIIIHLIHGGDITRMGPEAVVYGNKGDSRQLTEDGRDHHVSRVQ